MKRTVLNLMQEAVEKYASLPYLQEKDDVAYRAKSFSEVQREARYVASELLNLGFQKNNCISLLSEGRSSWVIGEYAMLYAGCISVPLSVKLLPDELLFRINHSESKAIMISKNNFDKVASIWKKISIPEFKIIYLDSDLKLIDKHIQQAGIVPDKDIVLYSKMVEAGKTSYQTNKAKLQQIEENTEEDDVVTICYTSGTTGNPKGIMLTHLNYYSNSRDAIHHVNIAERMRLMIILPLDHSFAHTVALYSALVRALEIYFVDGRGTALQTLKNIPINLKEAKPHFMLTVPALSGNFMNKIIDGIEEKGGIAKFLFKMGMKAGSRLFGDAFHRGNILDKLIYTIPYKITNAVVFKKVRQIFGGEMQFCVGGGALLDVKQQHFYYSLGIPIYQGYGLTEATPIISANKPGLHKMGSSGAVLPTIKCKFIDSNGDELKAGIKGELLIQGNNVMKGYVKNPEATAKTIIDGWLHTGDMGYIDKDNFLIITGREKALLISQDGEKYSPEEIEEAIVNSAHYVAQVMLYNDHSRYTTALITLNKTRLETLLRNKKHKNAGELLQEIIKDFYQFKHTKEYAGKFPEKWTPSVFAIVEEPFTEQNFMINSTLKMVRYKITEVYKERIESMYSAENSRPDSEDNLQILKKMFNM